MVMTAEPESRLMACIYLLEENCTQPTFSDIEWVLKELGEGEIARRLAAYLEHLELEGKAIKSYGVINGTQVATVWRVNPKYRERAKNLAHEIIKA